MESPTVPAPDVQVAGDAVSEEDLEFLREIVGRALVPARSRGPRHVSWLWDKRILQKETTLLAGLAGQGKAQIVWRLVAQVTTGKPETVLILNGEDPLDEVFVPRLRPQEQTSTASRP